MGKFPQVRKIVSFSHAAVGFVGFSTVLWKSFPMSFPRGLTEVNGWFYTVSTGSTITTIIILESFWAVPRRKTQDFKRRTFKKVLGGSYGN